jgi:hypothetical protein
MWAELKVDSMSAAVDMPLATRSKNHLSRVTTVCYGRGSEISTKLLILSVRKDLLISVTSSTCVQKGSGQRLM